MRAAEAEFEDASVGRDARLRVRHHAVDVSARAFFQGVIDAARALFDQLDEKLAAGSKRHSLAAIFQDVRQRFAFELLVVPRPCDSDACERFRRLVGIFGRLIGLVDLAKKEFLNTGNDSSSRLFISEPLLEFVEASRQRPLRNVKRHAAAAGSVGVLVERDVTAAGSGLVDAGERLSREAEDGCRRNLVVRNVDWHTRSVADEQCFLDGFQNPRAFVAHVCRVEASKRNDLFREGDDFFGARVRSRPVAEAG